LEVSTKELFQGDGLHFDVMDYDAVGKNERLGFCQINPRTMYRAKGERLSLSLEGKDASGVLNIRIRHATPYDISFMKGYAESGTTKGHAVLDSLTKAASESKGGKSIVASIVTRNEKLEKSASGPPVKKYRVRPGPDPKRPEATEWLTKAQMDTAMMEDSREWIDAGSGSLGRLFVEILQCQGLPNMDTAGFAGNKTDAFVSHSRLKSMRH